MLSYKESLKILKEANALIEGHFILSSGLVFNKIDQNISLTKENSNCFILSGLCLGKNEHQEIKTQINHLAPNCKSYQKIKNVL